jgi:diguanylate cyclase (GGDEF)-like protein/PAS domain S-box-containing protein
MRILSCIVTEHNILLVGLAALICAIGAWAAIGLLRRACARDRDTFKSWVFLGAVAAGSSVWCTHFVAMLAFEPQTPVSYEPGLTALSLVLIIFASAVAFGVGSQRVPHALALGGAVFGLGVAIMHYMGMAAFAVEGQIVWESSYLTGSILWAIALSALAFETSTKTDPVWVQGGSAGLLVVAVVGLHFTGMTAMTIMPFAPSDHATTSTVAREMLAIAIAFVTLIVVAIVWVIKMMDQQLRAQSHARMRHLAGSSADGLLIEQDGKVIEANEAFTDLTGFSREELIGVSIENAGVLEAGLAEGKIVRSTLIPKWGETIPVEIATHTEVGKVGEAALRVYAVRDIRSRLEQERKIADLARIDSLTGLPNRVVFVDHLELAIEQADTASQVGLIAIDLNRFKEVNDLYGHAAGDAVLKFLGGRMQQALEEGEFLARLGGDEFVVVQKASDRARVVDLAHRLEKQLFSVIPLELCETICGGSLGIAIYPLHASNATTLMNNADLAMYRAKGSHAVNICFYEEEMDEAVRVRRRMVLELREAIAQRQFELRFQVQVSAITEEITGYEALIRWKHPERGYISPIEFIPVAEETGLILQIGEWVLREACAAAASWPTPHKLAVNLSSVQLSQLELPALVEQILSASGLPPSRLELEITETSLMRDMERTLLVLGQLKNLGVKIAMDDFGTGYSSLSTLRAFPFDKIKLDKTFVDDVEFDSQARAVMLAVMALGAGLGIPVLAEGVETSEQLLFVRNSGCKEVQGYLFGRPAPTIQFDNVSKAVA